MNNSAAILRTLITYAIAVPLAIIVGYLATWAAYAPSKSNFGVFGMLALVMSIPILLRWHPVLLLFCWNLPVTLFFLPGAPQAGLAMIGISLGISTLQRTLSHEKRFISAPQVTWPLLALTLVVFLTAKLTGGFGFKSLGSDVYGGKKYIYLLSGVAGYFALTARQIPQKRVTLYIALFFVGFLTNAIGDLASVIPSGLRFIFLFFPVDFYSVSNGNARFAGLAGCAAALFNFMLAIYGVRGIFRSGKLWRPVAFVIFLTLSLYGGFRSSLISSALTFTILFFLQKQHRTPLMPLFMILGITASVIMVPLADKLPYTFQRSLAFLPLKLDPVAKMDAESSSDWRVEMWKVMLPQVPHYLLLGKGYALAVADLQSSTIGTHSGSAEDWGSTVAGDYHSGPLSVIIPFGIWGAIAFAWFLYASARALYDNFRFGTPELSNINAFLFAWFITKIGIFLLIFGGLSSDLLAFTGLIGLSVSLNGGVCKDPAKVAAQPEPVKPTVFHRRIQPFPAR